MPRSHGLEGREARLSGSVTSRLTPCLLGHEAPYASLDPPPDRQRVCPLGLRDLLTAICDMNEGQDGNDVCRIHVLAPLVQLPLYPAQGVVICRTLRADLNHAVDDR